MWTSGVASIEATEAEQRKVSENLVKKKHLLNPKGTLSISVPLFHQNFS